ncbi:MAG: transketolase [Actinomycetota bacterium]|nr:transketolase [Actinomycetota bacterium]
MQLTDQRPRRSSPGQAERAEARLRAASRIAQHVRQSTIEQSKRANVGHIGSALSIADILATLFAGPLADVDPDDEDRHRLVLSKGHAVLALYASLHATGRLSDAELNTYCQDGSHLAGHPEHVLAGIDFSTGSLGQGLSMGAGAALGARLQRSERLTFVVMSDAECNEGSVWEAAMFAAQHRLSRLVAIVDVNGQQALGYTRDVLDLEPLAARWASFGWDVHDVDGHDRPQLGETVDALRAQDGPPHVLLAQTTFGKGVRFMENRIEWHYLPQTDAEYARALRELGEEER